MEQNESVHSLFHAGVEKVVGNDYNYWKLCMEAYLQGHDLWSLISGDETEISADNPQNGELRRKWNIKCGKALFALRTSISREYIEHVQLDTEELVSNARLHQYLIRGLQEWPNQSTIIELENLLSNQVPIHKQVANNNNSTSQVEDVLYTKDQGKKNYSSK
ncbi:hypothetical protein AB3S75_031254 [Citrus x aurantiifolia]